MSSDLGAVRDEVKRTVNMEETLRICGLNPPKGNSQKINSPFNPNDKTPSFHVYDMDWYDYSTGQGGDQISFVQEYMGVSYMQALQVLSRGMSLAVRPREEHTNDMPWDPPDLTSRFESEPDGDWDEHAAWEHYVEEKWPYLKIVDVYSTGNKVTSSNELWTPHWVPDDDGKLVVRGIKVRGFDGNQKDFKKSVKGSQFIVGLYRPRPNVPDRIHAFLVEGESDAWVMTKMLDGRDVTILALPSGAGTLKDRYITELDKFDTVGIATDSDEPGQKAAEWVMSQLGDKAYQVYVPGGRVAEAAADGWTI